MITFCESGYTLRQIKGTNIVYITTPKREVKKLIGKLTKDKVRHFIINSGE
jgi:hypothetical protein